MSRPTLEVADIFRDHGAAWRRANVGHVSLDQMKVMSAIERCRTAALGGHVARCEGCAHTVIAYNSCRNRHCPKCQGAAAKEWLAAREADLLPVPYFHVVFTLPAAIANIAYQNKAVVYDILFTAAAETMPSRPGEFHPEPLTDPDLILSHHPARAIARRLPPSAEISGSSRFDPVGPSSTAMTRPLCSAGITPLQRYYGAVRPSPAHQYFRPRGWRRLCFSLGIAGQVLTFRTRA
jgi:hypothetical protein